MKWIAFIHGTYIGCDCNVNVLCITTGKKHNQTCIAALVIIKHCHQNQTLQVPADRLSLQLRTDYQSGTLAPGGHCLPVWVWSNKPKKKGDVRMTSCYGLGEFLLSLKMRESTPIILKLLLLTFSWKQSENRALCFDSFLFACPSIGSVYLQNILMADGWVQSTRQSINQSKFETIENGPGMSSSGKN